MDTKKIVIIGAGNIGKTVASKNSKEEETQVNLLPTTLK